MCITSFCLRPESSIKAIIALFLAVSQGTEHFAESNKYCISAEESTWTFFLGGLGTFIFTGSKLRPYSACTHLRNIRAFLTYVEIVALESERWSNTMIIGTFSRLKGITQLDTKICCKLFMCNSKVIWTLRKWHSFTTFRAFDKTNRVIWCKLWLYIRYNRWKKDVFQTQEKEVLCCKDIIKYSMIGLLSTLYRTAERGCATCPMY